MAKAVSDIVFDVVVPAGGAGVYLTRLVWWEGGDTASCELFQVLDDGTKVLIGDTGGGSIAAYKASGADAAGSLPADVVSAAPWPGQVDVNPLDLQVQVIIADGTTATVDVNSIVLTVNGAEPPKTAVRVGDKVRVTATIAGLLPGGARSARQHPIHGRRASQVGLLLVHHDRLSHVASGARHRHRHRRNRRHALALASTPGRHDPRQHH